VRYLVNRLSDERNRLDELSQGGAQVRAGLALSYRYLPGEAARLLRRLGLLDVPDFTAWAAAALLDLETQEAERIVEDLVDAQFLEVVNVDATGRLRYRFPTLVRLFAAERAHAEETEENLRAATGRFLRTLLTLAEEAELREGAGRSTWAHSGVERSELDPALLDELLAVPLEWFEAERLALVASVHHAARTGQAGLAWDLTARASVFFGTRSYTDNWQECGRSALEAAERAGDLRGLGAMNFTLGTLELACSRLESAEKYLTEALRWYTEAGEVQGQGMALRSLGQTERLRGRPDAGVTRFAEALDIFRTVGDPFGEVHALHNMAEAELDRGRLEQAAQCALEALRIEEARGADTRNLAQALYRLGLVRLAQGRPDQAEESLLRAVRIVKEKGDMIGLAHVLLGLAETRLAREELALARTTLVDALELAEDCHGLLLAARIGMVLGEVLRRTGRAAEARDALSTARERFAAAGAVGPQRQAEEALGSLVG
jgi:tetratricopeptide (TPR) repeat protein